MEIINNCQTLNILPKSGGLFDQDALFIYLYNKVEDARNQVAELDRQRTAAKTKANTNSY